jgi:uncharacterized protein YbjT (DUF2867 family)
MLKPSTGRVVESQTLFRLKLAGKGALCPAPMNPPEGRHVTAESRNDEKKSPNPAKLHSLADLRIFLVPRACDVTMAAAEAKAKAQYSAIVLGATGNVGGRIVQLLIKNPLCKKVVVVTRRKTDAFADPKVSEVVVNMDRLEEEVAPHAQGVDVALAAFGVGKGSAKMPEEEVRKIEIAYPQAFYRAAKAGGARVCGGMTAAGADPEAGMKYAKIIGEKEKAVESVKFDFLGVYRPAVILGNSNTPGVLGNVMPLLHWAMPSKYHSIHKNDLARAMVAQSEQAFLAIAQGNAP